MTTPSTLQTAKPMMAADYMTPHPQGRALKTKASEAAAIEGKAWASFVSSTGTELTLRGRERQTLAMLADARHYGLGINKAAVSWNFAEACRCLAWKGVQIAKVVHLHNDGGTTTGKGQTTTYVLLQDYRQKGELFYGVASDQPTLGLHGIKLFHLSGATSITEAARPFINSGLIQKPIDLEPLKPTQGAVSNGLRAGRSNFKKHSSAKKNRKRLNRNLPLPGNAQGKLEV